MPLMKLSFVPGVKKDGSRYSSSGTWSDVDKVRFRQGAPEKIGGWEKASNNTFVGTCRSMLPWSDLSGNVFLGVGTNLKYYIQNGGALYDITPIRQTSTTSNPFTTVSGSATVTVTLASHGAFPGDFVTFSGASAVGGLTLNGEYQIVTVPTGNTFTITAASTASSSATGGGSVTMAFQINVGLDTTVYGNGWGAGTWGGIVYGGGASTGWGVAAPVATAGAQLRLWSNDNYGQDLVINVRDGAIYYWVNAGGLTTRAVALSSISGAADVPAVARQIITSNQDQKIIAFACTDYVTGLQDRLLIRWSTTADPLVWTPLETNSAGGIRIPTGVEFAAALETKQEILVWSDVALHSLKYIGAPYEYGIDRVGLTTLAGSNAMASANDVVYWMGANGFFSYNGRINALPCPIKDYVFNDLNFNQAEKIYGGSNMSFNEVWWFYPSLNSEENDRFVAYNYAESVWFFGTIVRTCWIDRSLEDYPRATSTDGYIYFHELGMDDGSTNPPSAISAYIESGPVEIGQGDSFGFVWRMIPDVAFRNSTAPAPKVYMTLLAQEFPGADFDQDKPSGVTLSSTVPIEQFTQQTYMRLRGREITYRISSEDVGVTWRLGVPRIDVRADGRR